jgi:hypothetical protein
LFSETVKVAVLAVISVELSEETEVRLSEINQN